MIKPQFIEKLKNSADIVEIISKYIEVRKSGRSFVAICPFHDDSNPSLHINENKGFYHCFSCKASGDIINFIMEYEKINYIEAIGKLASFCNLEIEYTQGSNFKSINKMILPTLDMFYKQQLYSNAAALNYLFERKIDKELIQNFGIGFAPNSQISLQLLKNEGFDLRDALEVGAIKNGEGGFYASFSNRITFPIHNHFGNLIGFGARTISNHPAKYINSPQSSLFDKSKILYNFHRAKDEIYTKKEVIITEGYMDTIMLCKAGFKNTVAVLGTALTVQHLPLLKRENLKVILSFDGDQAGINAAIKSSKLLSLNKIQAYVVTFPNGADPADLVCANKIKDLKEIFEKKVDAIEFYIRQTVKNYDINSPVSKSLALEEICNFTNELDFIIAQNYQNLVSELLKVPITSFKLFKDVKFEFKKKAVLQKNYKRDILELRLLKTLIEDKEFFKLICKILSKDSFKNHFDIYEKICNKDFNDSLIIGLMVDEKIDVLEGNWRFKALLMLKIRQIEADLKVVNLSEDEILNKQLEIKQLKKKLKEI